MSQIFEWASNFLSKEESLFQDFFSFYEILYRVSKSFEINDSNVDSVTVNNKTLKTVEMFVAVLSKQDQDLSCIISE